MIIYTNGFNLSFNYSKSKRLTVAFTESFDLEDVRQIAKEVFNEKEMKVDYVDDFKDGITVNLKEASSEEIKKFEEKLKEKYTFTGINDHEEVEGEEHNHTLVQELNIPSVDTLDLVKIYVKPVAITSGLTILLIAIVFRKLGFVKSVLLPVCIILGINAIYISVIAITRIPLSEYTIAVGIFVYTLSLISAVIYEKTQKTVE